MLYLDRRRKARALAKERQALMKEPPPSAPAGQDTVLVAFASQAGRAERLAVATVAALRGAGMAASLQSVAALDAEQLRHHRRVLFVASTFGRSEERRVGKECRSRWSPDHLKKKKKKRRR